MFYNDCRTQKGKKMQIDFNNQQSFGKIDVSGYKNIWFERLSKINRHSDFELLSNLQESKPFDVFLKKTENGRLQLSVFDKNSKLMFEQKEGFLSALFNMNPVDFIYKTCCKAEEMVKASGIDKLV